LKINIITFGDCKKEGMYRKVKGNSKIDERLHVSDEGCKKNDLYDVVVSYSTFTLQ